MAPKGLARRRFISFANFDTGILAFECINSLISDTVYSLRAIFLFAAFLATLDLQSGPKRLDITIAIIIKRTDDHEHLLILLLDHVPALDGSSLCSSVRFSYWINAFRVLNPSTALA
jgi:hypothetical protein